MAVYDFKCDQCGLIQEKKIPMADYKKEVSNQKCEKCEGSLTRLFSVPVMQLKGNGWFSQDYAITDMETNKNLDLERRMEGEATRMMEQDRKNRGE